MKFIILTIVKCKTQYYYVYVQCCETELQNFFILQNWNSSTHWTTLISPGPQWLKPPFYFLVSDTLLRSNDVPFVFCDSVISLSMSLRFIHVCHVTGFPSFLSLTHFPLLFLLLSHSVVSDSLQPHGWQHARLPCLSPSPGVCSNSCPLSWWCHPTISSCRPLLIPHFVCPFIQWWTFGLFPDHGYHG